MIEEQDAAAIERQLGRRPRAVRRVAVRCPFGAPAVTEQAPYDAAGEPFPTTYYLTCPALVTAVSREEAAGGVERWGVRVAGDVELRQSLERATVEQRALRRELAAGEVGVDGGASLELGIGGTASPARLKCLHAHVAWALARPGYVLGENVAEEAQAAFPPDACCLTLPSDDRSLPSAP